MAKAQPALLLAIDCSNTGIKFGLYPHETNELRARWRVATVREKTVDEYAALCRASASRRDCGCKTSAT